MRARVLTDVPERARGDYVLYWMTAARRTRHNLALERAVAHARRLGRPLVVLEALRAGYPWASDRLHAFVIAGMRDNAAALARRGVGCLSYLEPRPGDGRGLLAALARRACLVVGDESPAFFLPRMHAAAAAKLGELGVRFELVDGNGLVPLAATPGPFATAASFRRFLQRGLPGFLADAPRADPLAGKRLPELADWPRGVRRWSQAEPPALASLPIDHAVPVVASIPGGQVAGAARLRAFVVGGGLDRYAEARNQPDEDAGSGLSPYLHFGHVGAHQAFAAVVAREGWDPSRLGPATGGREGYWGMSGAAEAFLDELVTWRELGSVFAHHRADHDRWSSLPEWARRTLDEHAGDPRHWRYSRAELERAATHDELWNAAQRQLLREGRIHNYLRMLWGKKILEWSPSPRRALAVMFALNDRWALDGRDPNSSSGILWVLGRHDRPWGPVRPIFGTVRYMSSENTLRKLRVRDYLDRYGTVTPTSSPVEPSAARD